jgi:type IV pilus assembly protein PilM
MKTAKISNFFQDKPLFGLDIGSGSLKIMQLEPPPVGKVDAKKYRPRVMGYGYTTFDKAAQAEGVIIQPEVIAKAAHDLFKDHMVGEVSTRRVAMAIPPYRTFTRSLQLPRLKPSELKEAVELEAEQYISLPLEDLYLDYEIIKQTPDTTELFVVPIWNWPKS